MENTSTLELIRAANDEPRVSSELIAERLEIDHESVMRHVNSYTADFEAFGSLRFEIGKPSAGSAGGRPTRKALLNENQCYLLFSYSKNTETSRALKMQIIAAFAALRSKPALKMTRREILELALEAERKAELLEQRVLEDAPKVEAFTALMDSTTLYTMNEAAKLLGTGRERLFIFLRDADVLMSHSSSWNQPYQQHLDAGRFEVKTRSFEVRRSDGRMETRSSLTTFVTTKGLEYIRRLLEKDRAA